MEGPTWAAVALAFVNGAQVVLLAYLAAQQSRSAKERIKRSAREEAARVNRPLPTRADCDQLERLDPR